MKGKKDRTVHSVLRQIPYGLYAIGVRDGKGKLNAFMGSWLTQCSFDPPLVMIAVNKRSSSFKMLKEGKVFSVNLLGQGDKRTARTLVKPAHRAGDKLGKVGHVEEDTGAPVLRNALSYLECKVKSISTPGDHAVVIGQVVNAGIHKKGGVMSCEDMRWHYAG